MPRRGQTLAVNAAWNPGRHHLHLPVGAHRRRRRHLGPDRHQRRQLHAHHRRARHRGARHGHGHERLRPGHGDERPGRPDRVRPAGQHRRADDQRLQPAAHVHAHRHARHLERLRQLRPLPVAARGRQRLGRDPERDDVHLPARQGGRRPARARARVDEQPGRQRRSRERRLRRAGRAVPARQHRRPGDHGHPAARQDHDRQPRHVDRPGQLLRVPVAARLRRGLGRHRRRHRRLLHADHPGRGRARARARHGLQPRRHDRRGERPDAGHHARRTAQPGGSRRLRHRAARDDADRHDRHLERHRQQLLVPVAGLHGRHDVDGPRRRQHHRLSARGLRRRPLPAPARHGLQQPTARPRPPAP